MRRLEEAGVITGYRAEVNLGKLGIPITAIIRVGNATGQSCQLTLARVSEIPEVIECYRVTGSDALIAKVAATSTDHLERIIDQMNTYGPSTTSLVLSKSMPRRTITPVIRECGETVSEAFESSAERR